jgi:spore photoproduct lyase
MGEMLDSLALDHITNITTLLVPFFSGLSKAYLMLLTKGSNIDNLLAVEPNEHTVVSWSLNAQQIIKQHELGTASLSQRIRAAKLCQEHGYRVRFRIDPGILFPDWRAAYADLIQKTLTVTRPENPTLGMLRLLPGHLRLATQAYGDRARKLCSNRSARVLSVRALSLHRRSRLPQPAFRATADDTHTRCSCSTAIRPSA